ncbi:MAG: PD40 domain-containing protein [Holophagales bacterium]|nr:MAG: PD40 domain-containing protein [Holophagales bacterium]
MAGAVLPVLLLLAAACPVGAEGLTLVSRAIGADTPAGWTHESVISADGRYVVLVTITSSPIPGVVDLNGGEDIYLWDQSSDTRELVSHAAGHSEVAGNGRSLPKAISADGRFVLFESQASDLVVWGSGVLAAEGVFLWDRESGFVSLVSHRAGDVTSPANRESRAAALSGDGRFVAFTSAATDLVAGASDGNQRDDAFLWDRLSGNVSLVSHAFGSAATTANGSSWAMDLSADGGSVAVYSSATDLLPGASGGPESWQAYSIDRETGLVSLVSHVPGSGTTPAGGQSHPVRFSQDGQTLLFSSTGSDLVAGGVDTNGYTDAFVWDRGTGEVTLVSHAASSATSAGNRESTPKAVSADGRFVTFESRATDLIPGEVDPHNEQDVFLWDRSTGAITLVSHAHTSVTTPADSYSFATSLSADGRFVAFSSWASDLVAGGTGPASKSDVFCWDRESGEVSLVSHLSASPTAAGNNHSGSAALSADGRVMAFSSAATDLVAGARDTNWSEDTFLWTRETGSVTSVSRRLPGAIGASANPCYAGLMSSDGRFVAFKSAAGNLIPGIVAEYPKAAVFLRDMETGSVALVSHVPGSATVAGNRDSEPVAMSDGGRFVAFTSGATNLVAGEVDRNGYRDDAYLWDRGTGTVALVSHVPRASATTGNSASVPRALSADGRFVAFYSFASDLIVGGTDSNRQADAFLWDARTDRVSLISHVPGSTTRVANHHSEPVAMSPDGKFVLFTSYATDLVVPGSDPAVRAPQVYLWERETGAVTLVSHAAGSATSPANATSHPGVLSADGGVVTFPSYASDLVAGGDDRNGERDVFSWDRSTGEIRLISHVPGMPNRACDAGAPGAVASGDGRVVAFFSRATDLVAGGTIPGEPAGNVFTWSRETGLVELVSHVPGIPTLAANGLSYPSAVSPDGRYVLLASSATDLVEGVSDSNATEDVFLWDGETDSMALISRSWSRPLASGTAISRAYALSADGGRVTLGSASANLVPGDFNGKEQIFWWTAGEAPLWSDGFETGSSADWAGRHSDEAVPLLR